MNKAGSVMVDADPWQPAPVNAPSPPPRRSGTSRARRIAMAAGTIALVAFVILMWPAALGGKATWVSVEGTSMLPNLKTGDLVFAWSGPVAIGDVVLYEVPVADPGGNIVHRLVSGNAIDGWIAQGDNKPEPDPWTISDDKVLGRMVFSVPMVGTLLSVVQGSTALAVAVGLLVTVAIIVWPTSRKPTVPSGASARDQALRKVWGTPSERLDVMAGLHDQWDGPTSLAPTAASLDAARHVIASLPADECLVAPWFGGVVLVRLWPSDHTRGGEGRVVEFRAAGEMVLYPDRAFEPGVSPDHVDTTDASVALAWLTEPVRPS